MRKDLEAIPLGAATSPTHTPFGPLLFTGDLYRGLAELSTIGFDAVEISLWKPGDIALRELTGALDREGLSVCAIATGQSYVNEGISLFDPDVNKRTAAITRVMEHTEIAGRLEANLIIGGIRGKTGLSGPEYVEAFRHGTDAILKLSEFAEKLGVTLLLEIINRYETDTFNTAQSAADFIRTSGCNNLKLLLDTFHMNIEEPLSVEKWVEKYFDLIEYIHVAENTRFWPGSGIIDFSSLFKTLQRLNYNGYVTCEFVPGDDSGADATSAFCYLDPLRQREVAAS